MHTESIQPTTMPATTEPTTTAAPAYQCRHIFTDGHRCGSRALRHQPFCFYHHQTRRPAPRATQPPDPHAPFDLPLPEDRSAIQAALGLLLQRIAANQLDPRRAGLLLYALQIASANLPKPLKNAPTPETVEEITFDDLHGPIAPQAELHKPQEDKNLEQILLEQWAKDDQQATEADNPYPDTLNLQAAAEPKRPCLMSLSALRQTKKKAAPIRRSGRP